MGSYNSKNGTSNYLKCRENNWKITVIEFSFGKAFSFQHVTVLKINFAESFFDGLALYFQKAFNEK